MWPETRKPDIREIPVLASEKNVSGGELALHRARLFLRDEIFSGPLQANITHPLSNLFLNGKAEMFELAKNGRKIARRRERHDFAASPPLDTRQIAVDLVPKPVVALRHRIHFCLMHRLEIAQISPARDLAAEIGETGKLFTDRGNAVHFDPSIRRAALRKRTTFSLPSRTSMSRVVFS